MTKRGKHSGKRRNFSFWVISSFATMFSKSHVLQRRQKASIWGKVLTNLNMSLFILDLHSTIASNTILILNEQSLPDVLILRNFKNIQLTDTHLDFGMVGDILNFILFSFFTYFTYIIKTRKPTLWTMRNVSTQISLRRPRRLIRADTFHHRGIEV